MSCDCITEVNDKLAEEGINTRVTVPIILSGRRCRTMVASEKADASKREKAIHLFASYCPFCGEKYKKEGR